MIRTPAQKDSLSILQMKQLLWLLNLQFGTIIRLKESIYPVLWFVTYVRCCLVLLPISSNRYGAGQSTSGLSTTGNCLCVALFLADLLRILGGVGRLRTFILFLFFFTSLFGYCSVPIVLDISWGFFDYANFCFLTKPPCPILKYHVKHWINHLHCHFYHFTTSFRWLLSSLPCVFKRET